MTTQVLYDKKCEYRATVPNQRNSGDGQVCGLKATHIDNKNIPVCGYHKRQANTVYKNINAPLCKPIEDEQ